MGTPTTPNTKASESMGMSPIQRVSANSPSAKRAIDFDFWSTSQESTKSPKKSRISTDFERIKMSELRLGKVNDRNLIFRISSKVTYVGKEGRTTLKFMGIDEESEISFVAFSPESDDFMNTIKVNECFQVQDFEVKTESTRFPTGSGHAYQIYLNTSTGTRHPYGG